VFAALASGGGGRDALQELSAAEYSKHLILLTGVLDAAPEGDQHRFAQLGYDVLAAVWRADRAATETVIKYPSVGTWAQQTLQAYRGDPAVPGAEPSGMLAVAAAAAIRARHPIEIEIPVNGGQVMLPSLGAANVPGPMARVRVNGDRAWVASIEVPDDPHQDALGWRGLHRVRAGSFDVLIDDLDPFRMPGLKDLAAHVTSESWDRALRDAWYLLESCHPSTAAEVACGVNVIVPRITPSSGLVSTSSPQAFGAIGMSLPPDPMTGAETLVHETQHLKLGAVQHIGALTLPNDGRRYYAPWRDDPRPLNGLLQGAYAYLGVTGFWRRQRHFHDGSRSADAEFARWREATALGVETIRSSGRLTSTGTDFVDGMASTLASWNDEQVPALAQAEARKAADAHLGRWQAVNGPVTTR
jgi:HEXXH motif-containing protein